MGILDAKRAAGHKAATLIESGMIVGLGSGSTSACFIEALIQRVKQEKLKIETVASSHESAHLAKAGGLHVIELNAAPRVDLTIDGADEIDPKKRMIKGGGGAHTKEKILAIASSEMVVIVDETKLVSSLGREKLPVEILFYGSPSTRSQIEKMGYQGKWRLNKDGSLFLTESGNLLFDIQFNTLLSDPEFHDTQLRQIPGVIATGFFFNLAGRVLIGHLDGITTIQQ
ncbi:MAG TPA: ribose-5-phosphate isomerase RpiA [Chlamydiales bacterium]